MAVVSCEIANGEFNSMPLPGLDTEFDIPYNIITNGINDSGGTIEQSGCLHPRFTSHPDNIFATLRRISVRRDPKSHWSRAVWRAVEHYSSVPLTQKEEQQGMSPLDRPADIDWVSTPYQVPVWYGTALKSNGLVPPTYTTVMVPIVNSAGDLPDPIPEKTEYFWVANVSKNVAEVPAWVMEKYEGSINDAPYMIENLQVEAECSRLIDLRISKRLKEGDVRYRTISFSLEFRARRLQRTDADGNPLVITNSNPLNNNPPGFNTDGFDIPPPPFNLELPDIGLHKWNPVTLKRTKFLTDDDTPRTVSAPVLMNGHGDKLADPTPFNMVLGNWRIMDTKDFSVLPLL